MPCAGILRITWGGVLLIVVPGHHTGLPAPGIFSRGLALAAPLAFLPSFSLYNGQRAAPGPSNGRLPLYPLHWPCWLSVNIELPSEKSLSLLAPDKGRHSIFRPMKQIAVSGAASREEVAVSRKAPRFAPAGQSTQMIVGPPRNGLPHFAAHRGVIPEVQLKARVLLRLYPGDGGHPPARAGHQAPLLREHRLYQADWLLRFYQFKADEILDQNSPNFNPYLDPKCNWAVQHYGLFPVDVNRAPFEMLLRVPGIGPKSARRIWHARKQAALGLDELKRMGAVLKRAQYFITCKGFSGAHRARAVPGGSASPGRSSTPTCSAAAASS